MNNLDFDNFNNITLEAKKKNPIFMTITRNSAFFSRDAVRALDSVPYVNVMTNVNTHQVLVIQNDSGISFKKNSRNVTWTNKKIINPIREMLPSDKNKDVRIIGEVIDVQGKKAILFSCDNLEKVRSKFSNL